MVCEKFDKCPFFQKYKNVLVSADYKLLMENYCHGALMSRCARITYQKNTGEKPPDNLSPIGELL